MTYLDVLPFNSCSLPLQTVRLLIFARAKMWSPRSISGLDPSSARGGFTSWYGTPEHCASRALRCETGTNKAMIRATTPPPHLGLVPYQGFRRAGLISCRSPRRLAIGRVAAAPQSRSRGAVAAEQLSKVEANAAKVFAQHLLATQYNDEPEVALRLLHEVVTTRKVRPELALGAALAVEQGADVESGAHRQLVAYFKSDQTKFGFSQITPLI